MGMPDKLLHPKGEGKNLPKTQASRPLEVETFDGKVFIDWDPDAAVTPMGQLPFFIEFLKLGNRFLPWVEDCPLEYQSNNAPGKIDVLGSLVLSILSGHTRYAHLKSLIGDSVNQKLLGLRKVVSDDSARRGLKKIDEAAGIDWLQKHLRSSYEPLLATPWILDADVTVKCLYGNQEGAVIGYNPKKRGRPSHNYHTYLIANLRLVLDVEVHPGDESQSSHSLPGLLTLLDGLPAKSRPWIVRGDCDFGSQAIMTALEEREQKYLFKLKKSKRVKELINRHHCKSDWMAFGKGIEAKESLVQLMGWDIPRRVIITRRRLETKAVEDVMAIEFEESGQQKFVFVDDPEDIKAFQYSVLVTNLDSEVISIVQQYRDRADCENVFDEIKNQWGWGGYTTHEIKSCRFISRIIALVYNWWTLFVRLANPEYHMEAITSKPLLLNSVGKMTTSGRQKRMIITSHHSDASKVKEIFNRMAVFFKSLKLKAPQLTSTQCWEFILVKAMSAFTLGKPLEAIERLPAPT